MNTKKSPTSGSLNAHTGIEGFELVKLTPLPVRKITAVLSQQELVLRTLGLEPVAA